MEPRAKSMGADLKIHASNPIATMAIKLAAQRIATTIAPHPSTAETRSHGKPQRRMPQ